MTAPARHAAPDAAWLDERVFELRVKVSALTAELDGQQAEIHGLEGASCGDAHLAEEFLSQARAHEQVESCAAGELSAELASLARTRHENQELADERCSLLAEIGRLNQTLSDKVLVADDCADAEAVASEGERCTARRSLTLQRKLRASGDAQAALAAEEAEERRRRRSCREAVRRGLGRAADARAELERRLASRNSEAAVWRARFAAAEEAERKARGETARLWAEAAASEESECRARRGVEIDELRRQLREMAVLSEQLRDELDGTRHRLSAKERRARDSAGAPWASHVPMPEAISFGGA